MLGRWLEVLRSGDLPVRTPLDPISRWLVIVRAAGMYRTVVSVAVGGLLATLAGPFEPDLWGLCLFGLLAAHATSNMINDLCDTLQGIDSEDYPRAHYARHPLLHRLVGKTGLSVAILLGFLVCLFLARHLTMLRGWPVLGFLGAGFLATVSYAAPPLKLKQRGLGELLQLVTWGPLMICGTYYVITAEFPGRIWAASLPWGIAVAAVQMCKHIDKRNTDKKLWVLTLPVLVGERGARWATQGLLWGFYLLLIWYALSGILPPAALIALASLPRAVRLSGVLFRRFPEDADRVYLEAEGVVPDLIMEKLDAEIPLSSNPVWPYWLTAWGMWWMRRTGSALIAGLLVALIVREISALV